MNWLVLFHMLYIMGFAIIICGGIMDIRGSIMGGGGIIMLCG